MNETPFTSKALREAYAAGAQAFGWSGRSGDPRSMKDGRELVGWGCATGMWDAQFAKTSASAKLSADGHLEVACATSDIGTGTYTVMTLVAADTLGGSACPSTSKSHTKPVSIIATLGNPRSGLAQTDVRYAQR